MLRSHGAPARSELTHWTILVGPGARLASVRSILVALSEPEARVSIRVLADVDELVQRHARAGRLVLDADHLAIEDVGFVRRFLERGEEWQLVLTGLDPESRTAERLRSHPRVRWTTWPVDVDELHALLEAPEPVAEGASTEREPAEQVEADAGEPRLAKEPSASAVRASSAPPPPLRELREIEAILRGETEPSPGEAAAAPVLPGYYRDQVADLADIAQRLELSLEALRESEPDEEAGERLAPLAREVGRLVQFTRTLGFLAAPPAAGDQDIDLANLMEEQLSSIASTGGETPRFLYRATPGLFVRSDKLLLVQAFDALLHLAAACATEDDTVRVTVREQESGTPRAAEVGISFPAGPLADLDPESVLRPYALRRRLPNIGPNALAAAQGILAGQGGPLTLERTEPGRLAWRVRLPLAAAPGAAPLGGWLEPWVRGE